MDIVIIGSGNVAAVLGRKFKAAGHTIAQIYSRNAAAATELAYEWDSESTNYKTTINKQADVYIIAVSDDAIDNVIDELRLPGKVVAHTAASVPKEILKNVTTHYGVFYPLQSLRKDMMTLPDVPIFFDGSDAKAKTILEQLAHSIAAEMTG
jgi:predicted dinucleotide-binding enzyme